MHKEIFNDDQHARFLQKTRYSILMYNSNYFPCIISLQGYALIYYFLVPFNVYIIDIMHITTLIKMFVTLKEMLGLPRHHWSLVPHGS
jgi:hypothetical protein